MERTGKLHKGHFWRVSKILTYLYLYEDEDGGGSDIDDISTMRTSLKRAVLMKTTKTRILVM